MAYVNPTGKLVYQWMTKHPGEITHYSDVANALKLTKENVNAALVRLVSEHPEMGIRRTSSGYYVFSPNGHEAIPESPRKPEKKVPEMYEKVGITTAGTRIVRDESGTLYRLDDF